MKRGYGYGISAPKSSTNYGRVPNNGTEEQSEEQGNRNQNETKRPGFQSASTRAKSDARNKQTGANRTGGGSRNRNSSSNYNNNDDERQSTVGLKRKFKPPRMNNGGGGGGGKSSRNNQRTKRNGGGWDKGGVSGGINAAHRSGSGRGGGDEEEDVPEQYRGIDPKLIEQIENDIIGHAINIKVTNSYFFSFFFLS